MQRPEEKKAPTHTGSSGVSLPRSRLGCVRRRARDGDMFLITPDTVVSLGNASTSATDRSTRQATWWAGMEACITKGGCKGYISAGSRPRRMASSPATSWAWLGARVVFFSRLSFSASLLASSDHTLFPIRLYSLLFWFVFIQQKIAGWLAVEYSGRQRGRRGVGGTDRWDVVLFPHFFFTFNGASAVSLLPWGRSEMAPSTKTPAQAQLLMVQSETKSLISEP